MTKKRTCPYCEKAQLHGKPLYKLTPLQKKKYITSYLRLLECPECHNDFIEDTSIKS